MRVLFVSDVYFPRVNGVSTSIRTFRQDLAVNGVETQLVAPRYAAAAAPDEPPIHVLPTGLPADRFRQGDGQAFRASAGLPPQARVVTYIGRVAHEKNIGFLVGMFADVLRQVPQAVLVIAGEGPARSALQQQVAAAGLASHVHFAGYLDRDTALLDCYAAADVFVFASRTETQGLVLLEAMAQGTPVVSTAELGTRPILAPGSGALVVPEERTAFAAAVVRVLNEPTLHQELAQRGRVYARTWSSASMAKRLKDLYEALRAAPGAARVPA